MTLSSTAAVVHVVHPLLEAPDTKKDLTGKFSLFVTSSTTSIARTDARVIGKRASHSAFSGIPLFLKNSSSHRQLNHLRIVRYYWIL